MIKCICKICGKEFYVFPSRIRSKNRKIRCSRKCYGKFISKILCGRKYSKKHRLNIAKSKIGNKIWLGKHHKKSSKNKISIAHKGFKHSKETKIKMSKSHIGDKNFNWKGGRFFDSRGYRLIFNKTHPHPNHGNRYVFEHRLVMEKKLGRYLKPMERIHHINKNPSDNRIENLMLFNNIAEHSRFHKLNLLQK